MLSKRPSRARLLAVALWLVTAACSNLPWRHERSDEVNLVFELRQNQVIIPGSVDGRHGSFLVGTAQPQSILDPHFIERPSEARSVVVLGKRWTTRFRPAQVDLKGLADGLLAQDVWANQSLTIDYQKGLVTLNERRSDLTDLRRYSFSREPSVPIVINGRSYSAIVDTSVPDTLVIPAAQFGNVDRLTVTVDLGGISFGPVDAAVGGTRDIRVGNRLLARFLVLIDYRQGIVALWPRQAP